MIPEFRDLFETITLQILVEFEEPNVGFRFLYFICGNNIARSSADGRIVPLFSLSKANSDKKKKRLISSFNHFDLDSKK